MKIISLLFAILLPIAAQAQFTYTTNDNAITITRYTGSNATVTIPSTVAGLPVTEIGDNAFDSNTNLTNVIIPDSVTSIRVRAFAFCINLRASTVPTNLTSTGDLAFFDCYDVTRPAIQRIFEIISTSLKSSLG